LLIAVALTILSTAYAQEVHVCTGLPVNTFVRNVARCDGWFLCTANGPVEGTCPSPWLFNSPISECDWEYNVQCFQCRVTVDRESIPVNGSCTQYIRCINGRATQEACQSGLHFNPTTQLCDLPANVGCEITFTCPPNIPPGQMVTFRSETNCSVFFVCIGQNAPIQDSCNPALHFDPTRQQCVFPNMTNCALPPPGDDGTTPNPGDPTTTPIPFTCPSDGHHRHPTDCRSFIVCASGTPWFFSCSDGLHFNKSTNQCDLPQNAGCS